MTDLNNRARKILSAIVNEYLATGEAVGSRTITRRYGVDLSAATVRNVMSDLEEVGLLTQPHTSAGRVPTSQGLRYFVDSLLKVRTPSQKEREEMIQRYQIGGDDFETTLRDASRALAELSAHTVVIVTPRPETEVLDHLEFMRLRDNQLLAVIVGKSGQVHNKIITTLTSIAPEDLERINNFLQARLKGRTLEEVGNVIAEELSSDRMQYQTMEKQALELSAQVLQKGAPGVIIEGQAWLLEAVAKSGDGGQMQKLQGLFRALEEKQTLVDLLERTAKAEQIQVFIGAETHIAELADFTVVATPYGAPRESGDESPVQALGMLGVIGPTRMNYSRVINLVELTAELVNNVIGKR